MKKHLAINIYGLVQGVSFRYYVNQAARELPLFGFVRNEPDGSVYIEAEGEEEKLNDFLKWCHKGPDTARVKKVEFTFGDDLKKFDKFKVY